MTALSVHHRRGVFTSDSAPCHWGQYSVIFSRNLLVLKEAGIEPALCEGYFLVTSYKGHEVQLNNCLDGIRQTLAVRVNTMCLYLHKRFFLNDICSEFSAVNATGVNSQ